MKQISKQEVINEPILSIKNLIVGFNQHKKEFAVHDLSFDIPKGKTFVLLGESGCGKSVTAHSILQLLPDSAFISEKSKIIYQNIDLLEQSNYELQKIRGKSISMIFQDPMTALNPVMKIGEQLNEMLVKHFAMNKNSSKIRSMELLRTVGIDEPEQRYEQYSHQLSGGQKQRVMIAIALAGEPELLIADEPTTALDVTTQAQILCLLNELQKKHGLSILLITHDLGVASLIADVIGVMYAGHLVEVDCCNNIMKNPLHPYTQELVAAIPSYKKSDFALETTSGISPIINDSLSLCRYIDRCPLKVDTCEKSVPEWKFVEFRHVRCHLFEQDMEYVKKLSVNQLVEKIGIMNQTNEDGVVLSVRNLSVAYYNSNKFLMKDTKKYFQAVDNISFNLLRGKTLAIVGESGSGKTSTGKAIVDLVKKTAGKIYINGVCLSRIHSKFRKKIQIVFQNIHSSLNPKLTVSDIILEGLILFERDNIEIQKKLNKVIAQVGLNKELLSRYPHQLSGGQRQRVAIARSLILSPDILILDEPTSALDVSIQAQILTILKRIQKECAISYLLISHDISVVGYMADEIIVMYKGSLVEYGSTKEILESAKHPYTKSLLNSIPENVDFTNIVRKYS